MRVFSQRLNSWESDLVRAVHAALTAYVSSQKWE